MFPRACIRSLCHGFAVLSCVGGAGMSPSVRPWAVFLALRRALSSIRCCDFLAVRRSIRLVFLQSTTTQRPRRDTTSAKPLSLGAVTFRHHNNILRFGDTKTLEQHILVLCALRFEHSTAQRYHTTMSSSMHTTTTTPRPRTVRSPLSVKCKWAVHCVLPHRRRSSATWSGWTCPALA